MNSGKPKTVIARRGLLLVMSSPSGAGKTTLSRALLASDHHIRMSVSVTTRPPRPGELDGKDYFFISKERFAEMLADVGPQAYDDEGFGVHMAFFSRTPAEVRMRILEGRRRRVEERREGLRASMARAGEQIDRYTRELHRLGLEHSEREVRWLNELIAEEQREQKERQDGVE